MARQIGRVIAAVALVSTAAGCLTACSGSTRSVEAFCSTMEEHKQAYLGQMEAAQGAGIDGLLTAISAVGDLKLMWKELAEVAPSDIQTDVEAVSEAWQKQEDNAGAGNWMASITTALLNSGSMSRVDAYVRENCDGDYTVDTATGADTDVAEEPEPEDYLATITVSTAGGLIADWDEYAIGPHSVIYAAGDNKQAETTREFRMVAVPPGKVAVDTSATVTASSATGSISDAVYGAQANTDADPGFVIAYVDEIPAAGAQPHNTIIMVKQFDGNGDAISEAAPVIDQFDGKYLVNVWLVGDIVALAYTDADYNRILIGVNKDGSIAWQREADSEVYYARDGILTTAIGHWEGANGKIDGDLAGIDAATGQPVWTLADAGFTFWNFEKPLGNGYILASTGDYQNDFLNVVIDTSTGNAVLQVPGYQSSVFYDAVTERFVAVGTFDGDSQSGLHVADASGNVTFSISADNFAALDNPSLLGATDGVVWISGVDGLDLFDATTGAQDPLVTAAAAATAMIPTRTEGFVSLLGSVIAIHQNQELTKELAIEWPNT
ncbi:hypothetical protein AB2L57_05840 [Microbacterium sp. HA-8]|uniref:hypothetical protein n=1 Tax=Microbacterium sp. HA-8 TaxID=3234200 RepID=UPI0038F5FCD4